MSEEIDVFPRVCGATVVVGTLLCVSCLAYGMAITKHHTFLSLSKLHKRFLLLFLTSRR